MNDEQHSTQQKYLSPLTVSIFLMYNKIFTERRLGSYQRQGLVKLTS